MANRLTINGHTFVDEKIVDGNLTLFSSALSDSLEADECVFTLVKGSQRLLESNGLQLLTSDGKRLYADDGVNFASWKYGDEIIFEKTVGLNTSEYLFFLKSVSRVGKNVYQIVGQSTIGMLASQTFKGGVYEGETAKEVIDEIFGDFDFSYSSGFDPYQKLYGWIPYTDSRSALQQVLFALGAVVVRSGAGWPEIRYPNYSNYTAIPDSLVSLGGSIELGDKVSAVELTEYSYFKGESFDIVFDNAEEGETADHALILFEKPAYEPVATEGLDIEESGANYAIVSGRGRLVVSFYGNAQKVFKKIVDANAPENVAKVDSCYLVSPANSYNVLERVVGYYDTNVTVKNDMAKDMDAGAPIQFTDPFGQRRQGIAEELSMPISGITKASVTAKCGWTPSNFGNNFDAERRVFCAGTNGGSAAYNWTKPAGVKLLYVALIGGGEGGARGGNGEDGSATWGDTTGGLGGNAGQNGFGGKFNVFRLEVPEEIASVSLHAGSGGNPNSGEGGESTISINGVEIASSEDGNESSSGQGWADIFTGDRYALDGDELAQRENLKKYAGGAGGGGSSSNWHGNGYDVATFTGGAGGDGATGTRYIAWGGGGGGAAYGSNGGDGTDAPSNEQGGNGGNGGDGAAGFDAYLYGYGHGGGGGNGGGGGGAGGLVTDSGSPSAARRGTGGTGGQGGNGGKGASGCVIIYY